MKHILLLATGGTIASRPTAAGGLAPMITSDELLACVPELAGVCHMDAVQLFNLDSTSVGPEQWAMIAAEVRRRYDEYDGFVITHGTDTMAYTAAALSYMIQQSPKPVVLTGSQKSIYNRDTDARNNLYRAVLYACSDAAWGVQLVFDGKVILGTRARKTRTKSFNAFSSIDYPNTAEFRDLRLIPFLPKPQDLGPVRFYEKLDPAVFVLRLVPGMRADIIPLLAGPRQLYNRNLLYTAVTRARKCVTIVGSEAVFQGMIDNDREQDRNTSLCDRIRELCQDSTDEL